MALSNEKLACIHEVIRANGIKSEFAKAAKRLMRETAEYRQAKKEGRARDWLEGEAASFAEAAYELLTIRREDLDA